MWRELWHVKTAVYNTSSIPSLTTLVFAEMPIIPMAKKYWNTWDLLTMRRNEAIRAFNKAVNGTTGIALWNLTSSTIGENSHHVQVQGTKRYFNSRCFNKDSFHLTLATLFDAY